MLSYSNTDRGMIMAKNKIYLISNICVMVVEFGYVLLAMFRLSEIAQQGGSNAIHTFDVFYIFVLALMTAAYLLSLILKNSTMFYVEKIFIGIVLSVGEWLVLSKPMYLEMFWGIPIYIAAVALYHNRKIGK